MCSTRFVVLLQLVLIAALPAKARGQAAPIDRVFIIAMENAEYGDVVGNASAPYLNSLIAQYGVAANYTGVLHPSLPNYMAVTGGDTFFTFDCDDCRVDVANIADTVETSGRTWTAYMEGMTGTCGLVAEGLYAPRHNPFIHYTDVATNPARCANVVPFSRFTSDLTAGSMSNYVWITPDLCHDMHDCGVASADAWLQSIVPSIVQSPAFANAVLFIWWDEGRTTTGGGGQVPLIVVSSRTPPGLQSGIAANHYSLLRTIENLWGLPPLGQSAGARPMTEFFNLLREPGFEQYQPPALGAPGWISDPARQTPAFSETHQPRSGSKNGACWTANHLDCGAYQTVTAPSTGTYTVTFYANADRAGGLVGANVNGALAASAGVQVRGFDNYGTPYTMSFAAKAGDSIVVWMYSPATPGYVVIDDVSLVLAGAAIQPPPPVQNGSWVSQDIGNVGLAGGSSYGTGKWTISGAGGAAVWGTADAFRFVYQPLAGDGQITARVDSLQNTTAFAKAGVMLRDGAAANAANVTLSIRPTGDLEFLQRSAAGGQTTFLATARTPTPYWIRLARSGSTVVASISTDGAVWVVVGATTAIMSNTVNAGVVVTSNDSAQLNTAQFEGVRLTPAPWTSQDVGAIGLTGNAVYNGGIFTIEGAGPSAIWGTADAFQFVYRPLTGDGEIVARVVSQQNTNSFAKVGVMMRDGLTADAAHVVLDIRPTADVEFMQRSSKGGQTTFYATAKAPPPYWLRLARLGSTITASISPDGATWSLVGSTSAALSPTIQVGVVVTSVSGIQLNKAVVSDVTVR
jgi:regulation of enolase protein 1 (concanavalin A-like superfamily)